MSRVFRPDVRQLGEIPPLDPSAPRICNYRNCLNTAANGSRLCEPCHEKLGIPRSRKAHARQWAEAVIKPAVDECTYIYCIQSGDGGPIKIGKADDVEARLAGLQVGNPARLRLMAAVRAPAQLEKQLHAYLDEHRIGGEWFRPEGEVLEIVRLAHCQNIAGILELFEARLLET